MKKFFELSLIFVFVLITSCTQLINEVGTESVKISLRAVEELNGSELIVTVAAKGKEQSKTEIIDITKSDVIKFDFGEYPVGTKISVTATVKNKSGEEIYKGATSKKIISGKNNIVLLLEKNIANLVVNLPRPNTEIDGCKLKVFVDGVEKTSVDIKPSDTTLTVPVNIKNYVSVVIENSTIRYFESDDYFFTDADLGKNIKLTLNPYGMFMWSFTVEEDMYGRPTDGGLKSVGFDVVNNIDLNSFYFEPTKKIDITGGAMVDNCIDSNGVAWILVTRFGQSGLEVKLERSSGTAVTIDSNTFEQSCYAMTNFKNGLLVVGDGKYPNGAVQVTGAGEFIFVKVTDDKTASSGNTQTQINVSGLPYVVTATGGTTERPDIVENNNIVAMCSDGDDIYIVMEKSVENRKTNVNSILNAVYKIIVTADGLTGVATLMGEFGKADTGMDNYYITDAEVTDGNLYITYIDMATGAKSEGGDHSRGGLLKINLSTKSVHKLNIVSANYCNNANCGSYLIGPRKILAIKPKKLIIADDGAVIEETGASTKKRIISVDLEKFIIESGSAVDLDGVFEGSTADSSCKNTDGLSLYYYKTNIHSVRG